MEAESLLDIVIYAVAEALAVTVGLIAGAPAGLVLEILLSSLGQALASLRVALPTLLFTLSTILAMVRAILAMVRVATDVEELAVLLSFVTAFLPSMGVALYQHPPYALPLFFMYILPLLVRAVFRR
jgi:hypothetical protein